MAQIRTTDLPEALQKLLLDVGQSNSPLTITHEGQPLVVITPVRGAKIRPGVGVMKGSGEILGDIVSPIEQAWDACMLGGKC